MLNKAKTLKGYKLDSRDGEIGKVNEFYFDDQYWTIRYLVADTGDWLTGRQVLISPYALVAVNKEEQHITVDLTKKQIEDSPAWSRDKPVSRQFEQTYFGYYGYPMYWGGQYMWGAYPYIVRDPKMWKESTHNEKTWDPHLRSTHNVSGYHIQAADGEIGYVEDFIIDDETRAICYLMASSGDTSAMKMMNVPRRNQTTWVRFVFSESWKRERNRTSAPRYAPTKSAVPIRMLGSQLHSVKTCNALSDKSAPSPRFHSGQRSTLRALWQLREGAPLTPPYPQSEQT